MLYDDVCTADRKLDIGCIDIIAQQVLRWMLAHK